jgi:hypothetical protein
MAEGRRQTFWLPFIALAIVLGTCFFRLLAHPSHLLVDGSRPAVDHADSDGTRPIGNDLTFFLLPQHLWISRTISTFGHIPLWDTRGFGGRPFLGNPQAGIFYPPVWTVWCSGWPAALCWLTLGHLFWGALGVFVLSRASGQTRWAATVGAGIFEASPYLLGHVAEGHYPHVWAACWYPWAFHAFLELRAGKPRGFLTLPVILALVFLAGHPQEWFLLVLALSIWQCADFVSAWRQRGRRPAGTRLFVFAGAMALSLGLGAVQAAPQCAVHPWLLGGHATGAASELPRRYHLHALSGFQLLSPSALGGPADYFGSDNDWESLLSIGLIPLILALAASRKHPQKRTVRGWLALAGFAVWFACGPDMLLYTVLYHVIPGMSWFRVPARSLFLANLACAVLAGMGVDALSLVLKDTSQRRRMGARLAASIVALIVSLALATLIPSDLAGRASQAASNVLVDPIFWSVSLGLAAIAILPVFSCARFRPALMGRIMGIGALLELAAGGALAMRTAPAARFLGPDAITSTLCQLQEQSPGAGPLRIKSRTQVYADLPAALAGFEQTDINDLFQLDHAAGLYETLYGVTSRPRPKRSSLAMYDAVEGFRREVRQAVFDRMSVSYLISERLEPYPNWPVVARGESRGSPFVIQQNPAALPRAYIVPKAHIAVGSAASVIAQFRELDPRDCVVASRDPLAGLPENPRQPFTPVEWLSTDPDCLRFGVTTQAPGLLVVTDTGMPGWSAWVDGARTPILVGNLAQRVVPLFRAGEHTIVMRYWPPGVWVGVAITSVSGLAWLALAGFTVRRRTIVASAHAASRRAPHLTRKPLSDASETTSRFSLLIMPSSRPEGALDQ